MNRHLNNLLGKHHGATGLWALFLVVCTLGFAVSAKAATFRAVSKALDTTQESCLPANNAIDPGETNSVAFTFKNTTGADVKAVKVAMRSELNNVAFPVTAKVTVGDVAKDATFVVTFRFRADGPCGATLSPRFAFEGKEADNSTTFSNVEIDSTDNSKFDFQLGPTITTTYTFANPASITINDFVSNTELSKDNGRAGTYPSTITVSGVPHLAGRTGERVSKVTVTLNSITHGYSPDIGAVLKGPKSQQIVLMRNDGGRVEGGSASLNGVTLTFAADAAATLPRQTQINSGTFQPTDNGGGDLISGQSPKNSDSAYTQDLTRVAAVGNGLGVGSATDNSTAGISSDAASFKDINPNGDWKLYIVDSTQGGSGSVAGGWSMTFTTSKVVCCGAGSTSPYIVQSGIPTIADVEINEDNLFQTDDATKTTENTNGANHPQIGAGQPTTALPAFKVADLETSKDSLTPVATSGNQSLIKDANIKLVKGTVGADGTDSVRQFVPYTIDYKPEPNANGTTQITVTITDGSNISSSAIFNLKVTSVNDVPTFPAFPRNQAVNRGTSTPALAFTVADLDNTGAGGLVVTAVAFDVVAGVVQDGTGGTTATKNVVPDSNIFFSGSGADRTVQVIPAQQGNSGTNGKSQVRVTATDASGGAVTTPFTVDFSAGVGDPTMSPTTSPVAIDEDKSKSIDFTIRTGSSTPVDSLSLTFSQQPSTTANVFQSATASGGGPTAKTFADIFPSGSISFAGTGSERTMTITPTPGMYGTLIPVRVTVTDNGQSPAHTFNNDFTVTVTEKNQAPTISSITPITIDEDNATSAIAFTIGDRETPVANLTVAVSSSNTTVVPLANSNGTTPGSQLGGSGANLTVKLVPNSNAFGKATITVTVTDGGTLGTTLLAAPNSANAKSTTTTFVLSVNGVNDAPTLGQLLASDGTTVIAAGALVAADGDLSAAPAAATVAEATQTSGGSSAPNNSDGNPTPVEQFLYLDQITPDQNAILSATETDQTVTITATSDNQGLIANGNIRILNTGNTDTNPNIIFASATGQRRFGYKLTYRAYGTANITVTLKDNGGTDRSGKDTTVRKFKIVVTPVNDFPSLDAITGPTGTQSNKQGVSIAINPKDAETSTANLKMTATSSDQTVVIDANLTFDASHTRIAVVPQSTAAASTIITVTATDRGPKDDDSTTAVDNTAGATDKRHSVTQTFTVTFGNVVVNNPPIIDTINGAATASTVIIAEKGVATATIALSQSDSNNNPGTDDGRVPAGSANPISVPILNNITMRGTSSDQTIVPNANILFGGTGGSRTVAVIPADEAFGNVNITLTAVDSTGLSSVSKTLPIAIRSVDNLPTISITKTASGDAIKGWQADLATFKAKENVDPAPDPKTSSGFIEFKVRDALFETPSSQLQVSATSNNQDMVPNANIVLTALAAPSNQYDNQTYTMKVTPAANKSDLVTTGTTPCIITIKVKDPDGSADQTATFTFSVVEINDLPTINQVSNLTITQDSGLQTVSLGGITTGPQEGTQTISSITAVATTAPDKTDASPLIQNIAVGALSGTSATLTFGTVTNKFGTATMKVTVVDSGGTSNSGKDTTVMSFNVSIVQVNLAPTLNPIADQSFNPQTATSVGPIALTVTDTETAGTLLKLSFTSDNPTLLPAGSFQETGSGNNRGLLITPAKLPPGSTSTANITVTVTDAGNASGGNIQSTSRTFKLTVVPSIVPTISTIANVTTKVNQDSDVITFTVADAQTPAAQLTLTVVTDNSSLLPVPNVQFAPVDTANPTQRQMIIRPATDQSGTANLTFTVTDKDTSFGGTANNTANTTFQVKVLGDPPTISTIPDQTVQLLGSAGPIPFTVGAKTTFPGFLKVTTSSSNTSFLPNANILLGGSGANRTITVGPVANASGKSDVTVTVADLQGQTNSTRFLVTTPVVINTAPKISSIANQQTDVGVATSVIPFTVSDTETDAASLTITKSSSNKTLVPDGNIFDGGSAGNRTVFVLPASGQSGTATITITVTDAGTTTSSAQSASTSFTVTASSNVAPTISSIANQTTPKNTPTSAISFTVGDTETAAASLTVAGASSSTSVVAASGIVIGGSGASRTVVITPVVNAVGPATITLTVTDGGSKTASTSFTVTVTQALAVKGDFDGDGQSDLLFQDNDGFLAAWLLSGTSLSSAGFLLPSNVGDPGYRVVATGDFNRDGSEDIIFQHTDGTMAIWFMSGTAQSNAALLSPSNPGDSRWRVVGAADLNKDGKVDLVFQHADGTLAVWFMDGTTLSSAAVLTPSNPGDARWKVVGVGDLNGDGKADLVFQHTDGTLATWAMNGTTLSSASLLSPANPGPGWRAVGTANIAKPFSATLTGASERPTPVTTSATASGKLTVVGNQLSFNINYSGLSGVATGAHIHLPANTEQTAGVVINFQPFNGGAFGTSGSIVGSVTLTADQLTAITTGNAYCNIHTAANPGGEIRGQIVPDTALAGKVDLLFQNDSSDIAVWFMDGNKLSSAQLFNPKSSGGTWKLVAPK